MVQLPIGLFCIADNLARAAICGTGPVLLLGVGGLRWGEAVAVRGCDIDWLPRRVNLHRNVTEVRGKMIEGSLRVTRTGSSCCRRSSWRQ